MKQHDSDDLWDQTSPEPAALATGACKCLTAEQPRPQCQLWPRALGVTVPATRGGGHGGWLTAQLPWSPGLAGRP